MAKGKLTAVQVRTARHPVTGATRPTRLGDGGGLYLQIAPGGTKSWLFRFSVVRRGTDSEDGKRVWREMGLGSAGEGPGEITLAEARQRAGEARAQSRMGVDPIEARQAAQRASSAAVERDRVNTFRTVAAAYMDGHRAGWRNAKHEKQWAATLEAYAYPVIGDMAAAAVATADVLRVLEPIWADKTETATRVRTRIEAVLDYATAKGLRPHGLNPAAWRGNLDKLLPKPTKVRKVRHHPALPYQQAGAFMATLAQREGTTTERALAFAILTAARSGEVLGMTWREVDEAAADWTIPAERMKNEREHRVPLSAPALKILAEMRPLRAGPDSYVFPGERPKKPLSNMALEMLLRRMNPEPAEGEERRWTDRRCEAITIHGFRSTFRDWTSEATSFPHEIAEAALSHTIKSKAEAAYRRGDLFEKRAKLMQAWGAYLARPASATVVPIRRAG